MKLAKVRQMVFILGFMAFWVQGDNYAASPLIVEIAKDLHLDISEAAFSVTAYMLPFGLFILLFGTLADRYGKAKIINLAAFGTAIFSALGAIAWDLTSLCIIRAINGAFAAAILPVTMSLIGDSFSNPKDVQNALGRVIGMMFLGGAVATAIGGGIMFIGSWRLVYLTYGIAEFVLAVIMLRMLEKKPGTAVGLNLASTYEDALDNTNLLKTVGILFLVGFSVFGSFTYAGKFVETMTGYNILSVGLILTFFGLATVLGGQITGSLKQKIGIKILLLAGILGCVSWSVMWAWHFAVLMALSLFGFGLAFIIIQPIVVTAAQQIMPKQRGTVMSLASFNMFVGGGLGTLLNGYILRIWGFAPVFICASALILVSGLIATYVLRGQVAG